MFLRLLVSLILLSKSAFAQTACDATVYHTRNILNSSYFYPAPAGFGATNWTAQNVMRAVRVLKWDALTKQLPGYVMATNRSYLLIETDPVACGGTSYMNTSASVRLGSYQYQGKDYTLLALKNTAGFYNVTGTGRHIYIGLKK